MADTISPSQSPLQPQKKSLKLRPLEQLQKIVETNQVNQKTTKMEVFEIQGTTTKNHIDDIIYPLIEAGITKAKVYVTKISDEAIHQVVVLTPIVAETFWGKLKTYLKWFKADEMAGVSTQKYTTNEDDDYTIIQTMEQLGVRKIEIPDDYDVISASMIESSYILFNSNKLNSINRLRNMGENNPSPTISVDFCESLMCTNDGKYKNSFKFSDDGSVVYAPEVTSSSFRALNCLAAEFELVGNQIVIRELGTVPEEYLGEIGNNQQQTEPQDAS